MGSKICAIDMPTWVSITPPTAETAQNTMPKVKPIETPMNTSLRMIIGHSIVPRLSIGVPARAAGRTMIPRLTMKLLRTIGGTVCCVISGSIRKAPMTRGSTSASASSGLPRSSNTGQFRTTRPGKSRKMRSV